MSEIHPADTSYAELQRHLRETATLASAGAVLAWDHETYMPPKGAALRGEQMAALSAIVHERRTSSRAGELLAACEANPELRADADAAANLRALRRDFNRATRLPTSLVRSFAQTTSRAMHEWRKAREAGNFGVFAPWLQEVVDLNRERAEALGVPDGGEAYDALLEDYEPGMTTAEIRRTFDALRAGLAPLIREVAAARAGRRVAAHPGPDRAAGGVQPRVMEAMGFDFDAGRSTSPRTRSARGSAPATCASPPATARTRGPTR
jgi:carboxypeptidase Taq